MQYMLVQVKQFHRLYLMSWGQSLESSDEIIYTLSSVQFHIKPLRMMIHHKVCDLLFLTNYYSTRIIIIIIVKHKLGNTGSHGHRTWWVLCLEEEKENGRLFLHRTIKCNVTPPQGSPFAGFFVCFYFLSSPHEGIFFSHSLHSRLHHFTFQLFLVEKDCGSSVSSWKKSVCGCVSWSWSCEYMRRVGKKKKKKHQEEDERGEEKERKEQE